MLLDTAAFLWGAGTPGLLSKRAAPLFQDLGIVMHLSSISISEIAIKQSKGNLNFNSDDVRKGIVNLRAQILSYTDLHAHRMFGLPLHHKDPFDRQIIAQALSETMPVVMPDRLFQLYVGIEVIW